MRRYVFRLAILSLAVLGSSAVRGDDQQIAQQIVSKLQAEKKAGALKGFSIDLQVDEGTVWLSGRVANSDQQAKALEIARRIPGVVQVVNDLTISAPQAKTAASPASAPRAQPAMESAPASKPIVIHPQVQTAPQPAMADAENGETVVIQAVPVEGNEGQPARAQGEGGEGRRHRDRRPRRRSRGNAEGNGNTEGGADPGNAPQPDIGLPAFLTAGGSAAE